MKLRNGFVSNSSSSSFIVAVPKNTKTKFTIECDIEDFGEVITTKEELLEYFECNYDWCPSEDDEDDDWDVERYKMCLKELEAGNKLVLGTVSNDDDDALGYYMFQEGSLKKFGIDKEIKIIQDLEM